MTARIITDSTADLAERYYKDIPVVPLTVCFGEEQFLDGIELSKEEFYNRLTTTKVHPTTSQASPGQFTEFFRKVKEAGEEAVVITVAAKLSGTYQSACIAAEEFDNIYVVDSDNAAIGTGILVEYAYRLSEEGMAAADIAAKLNEVKSKVIVVALVDTLEYLRRGGRISGAVAAAGGLLHIKPVLSIEAGAINMLGKARGVKGGRTLLNEKIDEVGAIDYSMPILTGYTGNDRSLLDSYIEHSKDLWVNKVDMLDVVTIDTVIGTHAGPGAVAVAFFRK